MEWRNDIIIICGAVGAGIAPLCTSFPELNVGAKTAIYLIIGSERHKKRHKDLEFFRFFRALLATR